MQSNEANYVVLLQQHEQHTIGKKPSVSCKDKTHWGTLSLGTQEGPFAHMNW